MSLRCWLTKWFPPRWFRKTSLGDRGEDFAARYLKRLGYKIVGRQVDMRVGELDIVAVEGRTIVFVELKTRTSDAAGSPAEAVDDLRQERMTRAPLAYLKSHGLLEYAASFDIIAVTWPNNVRQPNVVHIRDAFPAVGRGQFFS